MSVRRLDASLHSGIRYRRNGPIGVGSTAPQGEADMVGAMGIIALATSITQLQQAMALQECSATSLCEAGPTLRSVIEINPDAPAIAEALDRERRQSGPRSALHGIPVLVKDSFDTSNRMMTTAGSLALVGNIASRDAFVVERLRQAGAVLLGKTNMSEWGYMRSTRACSG